MHLDRERSGNHRVYYRDIPWYSSSSDRAVRRGEDDRGAPVSCPPFSGKSRRNHAYGSRQPGIMPETVRAISLGIGPGFWQGMIGRKRGLSRTFPSPYPASRPDRCRAALGTDRRLKPTWPEPNHFHSPDRPIGIYEYTLRSRNGTHQAHPGAGSGACTRRYSTYTKGASAGCAHDNTWSPTPSLGPRP